VELRREKETWQRTRRGELYTDDITVNPRTRLNSFQGRIFPFMREKRTSADSGASGEGPSHPEPEPNKEEHEEEV
jgi:hypothetical protein